jgi:hypothetical protein
MEQPMERVWLRRMRWRMRGAWQWPAFVALTMVDGLLIHALPLAGDATSVVAGVLLAGFFNLFAVAVLAPILGLLVRRRRRDLPRIIASDYAGTALLLCVTAILLAVGLAHRPAVRANERAMAAQADAVSRYVLSQAPRSYRPGLADANTWKIEDDLFRTCVPEHGSSRWLCLMVDTSQHPPGVTVDDDHVPNQSFFGSRGTGR